MSRQLLRSLQLHNGSSTSNTTKLEALPVNLLEALIPGYGIISGYLFDILGFDVTLLVSACLLVFAVVSTIKYVWWHASRQIQTYFMSYIRVNSDDDIYDYVIEWMATQKMSQDSRNLIVRTNYQKAWDFRDEDDANCQEQIAASGLLNFANWNARTPPKFEPSYGCHRFFHTGRLFQVVRDKTPTIESTHGSHSQNVQEEYLTLSCLGRSNQPVKALICEARDYYLYKQKSCTTVRRPIAKERRGRGSGNWMRAATRPSRPMNTIVLNHDLKACVLDDINEYLHPATPRWYSNRGIPYRRGYLLHGPPGCGKSSLAWAIAGAFGLDIYCISLVDPGLIEEELGMLFTSLPRRCVVLLEDIDSAGLSKRRDDGAKDDTENKSKVSNIGAEITKAFENVQKKQLSKDEVTGISLSGLLNAIDGVASHEGRVLIMTTNYPDKLDDALIRPGRIDMKIAFTNATRLQAEELFTRMYAPGISSIPSAALAVDLIADHVKKTTTSGQPKTTLAVHARSPDHSPDLSALTPPDSPRHSGTPAISNSPIVSDGHDLADIAARFAALLPDDTFTPAEIQGFLLTRKKDPAQALADVVEWRDALLAIKAKKKEAKSPSTSQTAIADVQSQQES